MRTASPRKHGLARSAPTKPKLTICVVAPSLSDYNACVAAAGAGVQVQIVASAEAALRVARTTPVDLWVVNTSLPGISGFELCSMLKSRSDRHKVHLVANEYSIAAEQEAWRSRATLFACKSAHLEWLRNWLRQGNVSTAPLSSAAKS